MICKALFVAAPNLWGVITNAIAPTIHAFVGATVVAMSNEDAGSADVRDAVVLLRPQYKRTPQLRP